jgi:hypothetical protein
MEATELDIGADSDWLVGNYPDGGKDVAAAGRIALSGLITDDQRIRG